MRMNFLECQYSIVDINLLLLNQLQAAEKKMNYLHISNSSSSGVTAKLLMSVSASLSNSYTERERNAQTQL